VRAARTPTGTTFPTRTCEPSESRWRGREGSTRGAAGGRVAWEEAEGAAGRGGRGFFGRENDLARHL
jgi:hypothetical protein